ncbi:MAG: PQQ-binding-like beta-propeller repeat protein [Pirellulales bacterium]
MREMIFCDHANVHMQDHTRRFRTHRILLALALCIPIATELKVFAEDPPESNPPLITSSDWPCYNHDVLGWRFNSEESHLSPENAVELVEKWRFPAATSPEKIGAVHATPSVVNGYVYFGTATFPACYKLKPDGTLAWVYHTRTGEASTTDLPEGGFNRIEAENGILTSALVTQTGVYFGDTAGVFYALDRSTGKELWKVDTRAEGFPGHHSLNIFNGSAILADGKVIVGGGGYEHPYPLDPEYPCCTGRGFVVAFHPATGEVQWKYDVGEKPEWFAEPVAIEDSNGKHLFKYGPSTSSVWSTPSYDSERNTIFFGTDVHNSPRRPTEEDPRYHTKYSAAVIGVDVQSGREKWVTQLNEGDIFNMSMAGYDPNTGRYKDCSIGDTPKVLSIEIDGKLEKVVGVGCKNGGFYVLHAKDGEVLANTPVYDGPPQYPLDPEPSPRMIAPPSPIGGIQTGCATDGRNVFTNGIDWLLLNTKEPGLPRGGRVVCVSASLADERWRHERPQLRTLANLFQKSGDPVGAGIALGGGLACFTTTVSEQLVVLDAASGATLKQIPIGAVWSGPSISRGRIYVGTGSILFFKKQITGTIYSFGTPGDDEVTRLGAGTE